MTKAERDAQRCQLWQERIESFQASNQSVRSWCREQQIPEHQMWYWLRKFKRQEQKTILNTSSSRWLTVEPNSASGISLCIGSVTIEIQRGFDPIVLLGVIRSLTQERC